MQRWWFAPRGGSMAWVAVLMLAIPPMILGMANGVRLVRAVYAVRGATYTACQAAAEAAVDEAYYRTTGQVRLQPVAASQTAAAMFQRSLAGLQRQRIVDHLSIAVSVNAVTVICRGEADYHTWGVPPTTALEVVHLRYGAQAQARAGHR